MCSWWQPAGVSAIAAMTSSVNSRGCGLVKRTRSRPSSPPVARSRAANAPRARDSTPAAFGGRAAVAEPDAVGVDVLAQQRHLEDPLVHERLPLGQDLARPAVLL